MSKGYSNVIGYINKRINPENLEAWKIDKVN